MPGAGDGMGGSRVLDSSRLVGLIVVLECRKGALLNSSEAILAIKGNLAMPRDLYFDVSFSLLLPKTELRCCSIGVWRTLRIVDLEPLSLRLDGFCVIYDFSVFCLADRSSFSKGINLFSGN